MENLILQDNRDYLRIDTFLDFKGVPVCRVTCIEDDTYVIGLDGEWIDEEREGSFHLNVEQIDKVIENLKEAKEFLTKNGE